ncbi:TatD family hydrolase [Castellaniella defragrans]|uniref:TatD DNase family protein n=1 Tax=Castellaniella defragrans TaxID=75697 RepID=A0A7W9WQH3_CASDE|nr:TatD family hydrolase [Castellaniella defragrans]KAB0594716.1 TatD family deoxyribonuclease [Castellaniella defragrans]MBB6085534.1 TatD DNase family protein [Castellaniella defragrans]
MYIDSHCHLNFPALQDQLPDVLERMRTAGVGHALVVSVNLRDWPGLMALVERHPFLRASVGVHPDNDPEDDDGIEPTLDDLVSRAAHPRVVAIGETGLDYYRQGEPLEWQRERFRTHIRAAHETGLPLIIHTRAAAEDTLRLMREERAPGGVMHCFTESWEVAQAALDLGFHISLSGIVTFKNAVQIQDVARRVPLDRLLIETDSPYLAPVPYRGKLNDPSRVIHVAEKIAELRGVPVAEIERASAENYWRLFDKAAAPA